MVVASTDGKTDIKKSTTSKPKSRPKPILIDDEDDVYTSDKKKVYDNETDICIVNELESIIRSSVNNKTKKCMIELTKSKYNGYVPSGFYIPEEIDVNLIKNID